jgi:hypothetical protein
MAKITFKQFHGSLGKDELISLATKANTSVNYLYQIANGIRRPGANASSRLKQADSRITDSMLRPDLYA